MDLASAVIGIASFGVQVSSALYQFSDAARNAEADIVGLAQNIDLTSNVLQSVGQILQRDEIAQIPNLATKTAIEKTLKGCETLFKEIMSQVSKKRKLNDDGSYGAVRTIAKFTWPFQKDRMDFNTRKLEHMKTLMLLLLQVLQLAATRTLITSVPVHNGVTNTTVTDQGSSILALKKRLDTLESQFPDLCLDEGSSSTAGTVPPSQDTAIKADDASVSSSRFETQQAARQGDSLLDSETVLQAGEEPQAGSLSDSGIYMQQSFVSHQSLPESRGGGASKLDPLLTEAAIDVCFESINIVLGQLKHCQRCLYLDEQPYGDKLAAQRDLRAKFDDMVATVHSTLPHGNEQGPSNARLAPPSSRHTAKSDTASMRSDATPSEEPSLPIDMLPRSVPALRSRAVDPYDSLDSLLDGKIIPMGRSMVFTSGSPRVIETSSWHNQQQDSLGNLSFDSALSAQVSYRVDQNDIQGTFVQPRYEDSMYRDLESRRRYVSSGVESSRRRPSSSIDENPPQSRPSAKERHFPTSSALDSHANIDKDVLSDLVFKYTNLLEFDGVERPQQIPVSTPNHD